MSEIDAVIFDLGNVLLMFDWDIAADRLCARTGRTRRELDDYVVTTPFVTQFGLGQLSKERFYQIVSRDLGFDGGYDEFALLWTDIFTPNEPMIALAMGLKGKVRRFILSNTNQMHMDFIYEQYPFIHGFNGYIFSHEAGLMKPDPRIYSMAIQKFGLTPERTVFVDDIVANVEGARELGIHAIHYENVEQVRRELTKLGVVPI